MSIKFVGFFYLFLWHFYQIIFTQVFFFLEGGEGGGQIVG